jgi:glycosyltransferase involved in cell wall biosynthesis
MSSQLASAILFGPQAEIPPSCGMHVNIAGPRPRTSEITVSVASEALPVLRPIPLAPLSSQPKVSVLVSSYNYRDFLAEAIESVLAQSWQNFQLIICDDGSTDGSAQVARQYSRRDSRIRVIEKENGGQGSGLNAAFRESSGEILCLMDADDIYRPEKLERVVQSHQRKPDAGFGLHRVLRVDRNRRPQGVWPLRPALPEGWHGESMLADGGVLSYMPPTSGLSLHRSVAERVFPLPEEPPLTGLADQVITRRAPLLTCVVRSLEVLAEYRLHGSNSYEQAQLTAATVMREIESCRALWEAERKFLGSIDPLLIPRLRPVEESSYLIYLEYLHARMSRSPAAGKCHRRLIRDMQGDPNARLLWFWRSSIYLPPILFERLVNFMSRQSAAKQILARLCGVV